MSAQPNPSPVPAAAPARPLSAPPGRWGALAPQQMPTSVRRLLLTLILTALTLGIYANSIGNPFLIDDHDIIVSHPDVNEPAGLTRLWTSDYWAGRSEDRNLYRPISILSYHLN